MHARISQQYIQLLMDKQVVSCIVTHVCCLSTIYNAQTTNSSMEAILDLWGPYMARI